MSIVGGSHAYFLAVRLRCVCVCVVVGVVHVEDQQRYGPLTSAVLAALVVSRASSGRLKHACRLVALAAALTNGHGAQLRRVQRCAVVVLSATLGPMT